jgi:two-component system, LytTR family, response regulator
MTAPCRAYLVDDEPLALRRLARMLEAAGGAEIAGSATDPEAALEFLSRQRVDALFLDIEMPGMNGFELLARLPAQPPVIFTTAFDQYALKAFEVNSIDYLLKPVEEEQLARALNKLRRLRGGAPEWMQQPELTALLERLGASLRAPAPAYPARIASRTGGRVHLVEVARVTHFFARDKLTWAAAGGREHLVDHTIAELEQRLDPRRFVRIHRAVIVNLDWVGEMDSWFGGGLVVRLKDEKRTELTVSRDRARALKERLL